MPASPPLTFPRKPIIPDVNAHAQRGYRLAQQDIVRRRRISSPPPRAGISFPHEAKLFIFPMIGKKHEAILFILPMIGKKQATDPRITISSFHSDDILPAARRYPCGTISSLRSDSMAGDIVSPSSKLSYFPVHREKLIPETFILTPCLAGEPAAE